MMTLSATDVLEAWLTAINSSDTVGLQQLYRDDAVLVPTFSDVNRHSSAERADYFAHFATDGGVRVELIPDSQQVTDAGSGTCIVSGFYAWDDLSGFPPSLARYSFVIDITTDSMAGSILHHHSSLVPDD